MAGKLDERSSDMSQQVEFDEQRSYQAPSGYNGVLYQGQQASSGGQSGQGQVFIQSDMDVSTTSRHRLILGICSLGALAVAVTAFVSALETWPNSSIPLFALIGLGLVCASIVALNVTFNLRR
jgi:hypothetical protein